MQALTILDVGQLGVQQHPDPTPGAGEVLVRVHAAGLNAADIAQRAGTYPAPAGAPADIPGLEFAGEVIAVGHSALRFSVGDRVMSIVSGGGQAELIAVHERQLMPVPDALSWKQAGGFPEVFLTAHDALVAQAGLRPGERVLINGAGGGVGMAAVQIASVLGAEVVASVRNPAIRGEVVALGASAAVVPVAIDPAEVAKHGPYDVVLELVSGDNVGPALSALNQRGRIVIIGASPESMTVELDLNLLRAKRALLTGSTLRSRPLEEKAAVVRDVEREILPHVASGRITVPLAASFALADGQEAYDSFHGRGKFGKIVLLP